MCEHSRLWPLWWWRCSEQHPCCTACCPALLAPNEAAKPAGTRARRCWGGTAASCRAPAPARARWRACARASRMGAPSPCAAPRAALRIAVLLPRAAPGLSGEGAAQVNLLNYQHDGTPFVNHLHIAPIRNSAGEVRPVGTAVPQQTADRTGPPVALRPCRRCDGAPRCRLQTSATPGNEAGRARAGGVPGGRAARSDGARRRRAAGGRACARQGAAAAEAGVWGRAHRLPRAVPAGPAPQRLRPAPAQPQPGGRRARHVTMHALPGLPCALVRYCNYLVFSGA